MGIGNIGGEAGLVPLMLAFLLGYAFGSIPFGLVLSKMAGLGDVRKVGSGNIGATNVLRTGHKGLAAATLLLDLLKGFAPVAIAGALWPDMALSGSDGSGADGLSLANYAQPVCAAALGAVIGHCFPVWLGFKGGKGVATNAGVCFGLAWPIGLTYALVWIGVLAIGRMSSLAGMSAVVAACLAAWLLGYQAYVPVLALIAVLICWLHRDNIRRLAQGTEPRIGSSN